MSKTRSNSEQDEMTFLEHLEDLRWHLVRSLGAVFILALIAFMFKSIIFDTIILGPQKPDFFTNRLFCQFGKMIHIEGLCINKNPLEIINYKMTGQFMTHIMISIVTGIVVAFPYIFYEFWRFISPAFYANERSYTRGAVFYCSVLFLIGIAFGYYIISPLSVNFLGNYMVSPDVANKIQLMSYIGTITSIVLANGILFELPVLVFFLTKIGLLTPEFLKKYRRHALVIILAISAIITPPDIFSQILVCFPLIILYEIGIVISRKIIKKEKDKFDE